MTEKHPLTYDVPTAAKLLGVSRSTAYEAVRRGQIPAIRIGTRLLIPQTALHSLLDHVDGHDEQRKESV